MDLVKKQTECCLLQLMELYRDLFTDHTLAVFVLIYAVSSDFLAHFLLGAWFHCFGGGAHLILQLYHFCEPKGLDFKLIS